MSFFKTEDKRICKTKKALKQTLIAMLEYSSFANITVTELCDNSHISRITFYNHYSDKFDLVDDIFKDMVQICTEDYNKLQKENNSNNNPITGFCNVLDAILDLFCAHIDFFKHTNPETNPYLASSFYQNIFQNVEMHTSKESTLLIPKYSLKSITGFLCYGLCGYIYESHTSNASLQSIRTETKEILKNILEHEILTINSRDISK